MPTSTALLEQEAQAGENMAAHRKDDKMAHVGLHVQHED